MSVKRVSSKLREQLKSNKKNNNKLDKLIKILIQKNVINKEDFE